MTAQRWKGCNALVTGASSGIGEGIALAFAQRGMRVAIAARRVERLQSLASRLREAGAEDVLVLPLDMRDTGAIADAFAALEKTWSEGVHVLVNNAGLGLDEPLMDGETEAWRTMLEVNVLGLAVATREALAQMKKHGAHGHIIHISSMASYRVNPGSGMYSATKHAVRALTEGLRKELRAAGSPIRVSAISPGFVATEFAQVYHRSEEKARQVYGRFDVLQVEDICRTLTYILDSPPHMEVHDVLLRPTDQET